MTDSNPNDKTPLKDQTDKPVRLTTWQIIKQAFSLLLMIQSMKQFEEASKQMEHNIAPVILAGIMAMVIFMGMCFTAVYLALQAAL